MRRSLEWVFNSEHPEFMSREEAAQWRFMPLHEEAKQFFGEVAGPDEPGWPNP